MGAFCREEINDMMKKWISLVLVALMLAAFVPAATMAEPSIDADSILTIVNCKNSANVRSKASSSSKKLGEAKRGSHYQLVDVKGDWYMIQYKNKVGYVYHKFGLVGKKGDIPTGKTATVTNAPNGVNIRSKASSGSSSKILGDAHNGDTFEVKGTSGKWTKVVYEGGTAYIFSSYLTTSGGSSSSNVVPVDNKTAYIDCNNRVNVRAKASSSSDRLGTLPTGSEITVTGTKGKWTRIAYEGDVAWVFSQYVTYTKPDADIAGKTVTIVNCKKNVNVRANASSSSTRVGVAEKGDIFTALGRSGKWIKVEFEGEPAYIYKKYTKIS